MSSEEANEKKKIVKKLTEKAEIDTLTGHFIFDEDKVVENVIFSSHKFNNKFCYGFLLPKDVPVYSGRGAKTKVIGREQIRSPAVLTSSRELIEPTNETENNYKIKYTAIPKELELRISLKVIEDFLKKRNEKPEGKDIFNSIRKAYERFLYFQNPIWYDIHALWDMGTYFFQLFNSYPLLELRGLSGTAKSKIMQVSQLFTLNPTKIMINPSEASLFRITHSNRPTKYIDECEKLFIFIGGTWQSSPIVELINGSYTRGSSVPRLEKTGNNYKIVNYGCYSPTMLGSIAGLRDATETRAITHITTKSPDIDDRGQLDVEDYANEQGWQETRNKLYLFALENWEIIEKAYKELKLEKIKKRDFQLWKPLLSITKVLDIELFNRILEFAEKQSEQKKQDFISENTIDFKLLKFIKEQLEEGKTRVYVKAIANSLSQNILDSKDRIAEKTISAHLDKVGFKEFRERDMYGSFFSIDKNLFETIIAPVCPSLSSYSTYSPYYKGKEEKKNDEGMMNDEEKEKKEKMLNMTQNVEYDDTCCDKQKLNVSYEKVE